MVADTEAKVVNIQSPASIVVLPNTQFTQAENGLVSQLFIQAWVCSAVVIGTILNVHNWTPLPAVPS